MPTRLRLGPSTNWARMMSAPGKPPASARRLEMVQPSLASTGVVAVSMS